MDLVAMILGLPAAPFRGLGALLGVLRDEAERELYQPSELRKQAEETDALAASGEISQEEAEQRQEQEFEQLLVVPGEQVTGESDREEGRPSGGNQTQ